MTVAGADHRRLTQAWAEHAGSFEWDHWMTLTPRFFDCAASALVDEFKARFIRTVALLAQRPIPWLYACERSPGGVFHLHALVSGTAHLTGSEMRHAWRLGISHVERYDGQRGAAAYLTKTLNLAPTDWERWDFSKRTPPRRVISAVFPASIGGTPLPP